MAGARRRITKKRAASRTETKAGKPAASEKRIETLELQIVKLEEKVFALDELVRVAIPQHISNSRIGDDGEGNVAIWTGPVLTASATAQFVASTAWWAVAVNLSSRDFWGNVTPIAGATVTSKLTLSVAGARISPNANGNPSVGAGANQGITTDAFGDTYAYINSGARGVARSASVTRARLQKKPRSRLYRQEAGIRGRNQVSVPELQGKL